MGFAIYQIEFWLDLPFKRVIVVWIVAEESEPHDSVCKKRTFG